MNQNFPQAARSGRSWRVVGIAVIVLVIGVGLVVALALWPFIQQLDTTTEHTAETYDRAPERVIAEGETAEIDLVGTAADEVAVDRQLEWARTKPDVVESWQGDDLVVDLTCSDGLFGWVNDICRIDYRAEVPTSATVELTATTGDISVDGVAGDIAAATTTGSVYGTDLEAGRVAAQATTGSIELGFTTTPQQVSAELTTGHIVVTVPDDGDPYRVVGETETGDRQVRIATDPSSDRVIDVSTTTGDVTVRYPG